jgi:hypothetical protein
MSGEELVVKPLMSREAMIRRKIKRLVKEMAER